MTEKRRAARLRVKIPTLIEVVGQREPKLHPALESIYERVKASKERVGEKLPGVIRDLSTNGAYIAGPALPLLSRVAFTFALSGYGQIEVLAWSLWRRTEACEIPAEDGGASLQLDAGFGVLFEAISLDARRAIADVITRG